MSDDKPVIPPDMTSLMAHLRDDKTGIPDDHPYRQLTIGELTAKAKEDDSVAQTLLNELPEIPDDHPIREHWRNSKLLQSVPGRIQLAKEGDSYAAKQLLALFIRQVGFFQRQLGFMDKRHAIQTTLDPDLLEYLCDCFRKICEGDSAGVALHLRPGKRIKPKLNYKEIREKVSIGSHVASCIDENMERFGKRDVNGAYAEAANKFGVSISTARDAYNDYIKIKDNLI